MAEDDAARFRKRARECREMAELAGSAEWRNSLLELAEDLEKEADEMESEADPG